MVSGMNGQARQMRESLKTTTSDDDLIDRVHSLSDLELAVLLSLVSQEHCVIGTPAAVLDDLVDELFLIATKVFGLRCAVVDCHDQMTVDDFAAALLLTGPSPMPITAASHKTSSYDYFQQPTYKHDRSTRPQSSRLQPPTYLLMTPTSTTSTSSSAIVAGPAMANITLARHLNRAPEAVQIQALELLRAGGQLTVATQLAPGPFLFVAVTAAERGFHWQASEMKMNAEDEPSPHMTTHLNDFFAMAHWHDPNDGYPNLAEEEIWHEAHLEGGNLSSDGGDGDGGDGGDGGDVDSDSDSIIRHSEAGGRDHAGSKLSAGRASGLGARDSLPFLSAADTGRLAALSRDVRVDVDVMRYQLNVVAFLRMHRAVAVIGREYGGISCVSPTATKHFEKLAQCLAPLHRLDYVTPSLVALAARKVYLHRIRTIDMGPDSPDETAPHERSMQWGSSWTVVEDMLERVSPGGIIEDVLGLVVPPV